MILDFLSNRLNLTLLQCLLYIIVGYTIGQYLTWMQLIIIGGMIGVIQFITHVKAVADGMLLRQIMFDNQIPLPSKDEYEEE